MPASANPIHRLPSLALSNERTTFPGSGPYPSASHDTKRWPSNRSRPDPVPTQRYPSLSWQIAQIGVEMPSRRDQDVMVYSRSGCGAASSGLAASDPTATVAHRHAARACWEERMAPLVVYGPLRPTSLRLGTIPEKWYVRMATPQCYFTRAWSTCVRAGSRRRFAA